jgi:MFS family permease
MAHDPFAALRLRDFRLYLTGNLIAVISMEMLSVAIGWELYERTGSALVLAWVGLLQALPIILLSLPAGHLADRLDRKKIVMFTQLMLALCFFGLAGLSSRKGPISLIYLYLLLSGIARAFNTPARSAFLAQIVPLKFFSNAVTWNSSVWQIASMSGPALAGLIIAAQRSATLVYSVAAVLAIIRFILVAMINSRHAERSAEPMTLKSLLAGIEFVWNKKIILATITLDLFAVLLGGATALLPIFAKDILRVGPSGLGWLRAAPSVGAFVMAFSLAYMPPMKKAGRSLLLAVAGFGLATIVFGISRSFWLSMSMLFLAGALDNISVVVRHTLVQLLTPDNMRGRVSAVNNIFIASSNELGGFESGLVAQFFGPIISVVSGGIGTILVVLAVVFIWPQVQRYGSLGKEEETTKTQRHKDTKI